MEKQDKKINKDDTDLIDKLVGINRVAKVVKGGRRFGFSALVVVGNQNGKIGEYKKYYNCNFNNFWTLFYFNI